MLDRFLLKPFSCQVQHGWSKYFEYRKLLLTFQFCSSPHLHWILRCFSSKSDSRYFLFSFLFSSSLTTFCVASSRASSLKINQSMNRPRWYRQPDINVSVFKFNVSFQWRPMIIVEIFPVLLLPTNATLTLPVKNNYGNGIVWTLISNRLYTVVWTSNTNSNWIFYDESWKVSDDVENRLFVEFTFVCR